MKNYSRFLSGLMFLGLILAGMAQGQPRTGPVPGRFVVKLTRNADAAVLRQALGGQEQMRLVVPTAGTAKAASDGFDRIYVFRADTPAAVADVVRLLGRENAEWVEEDYYLEQFDLPSDPLFPHQWHLLNTGQEYYGIERVTGEENDLLVSKSGTVNKDLRLVGQYLAPRTDTAGKVIVGVLDTGVDTEHPELAGRIWRNLDEIPGNGADDDHNGYVDDTVGFDISGDSSDFFDPQGDADPRDPDGHGTHIAGIVAANADGVGVVGIAPMVEIMPVKIMPNGTTAVSAGAIVYAVNNGARVINISWGTPFQSQVLREALDLARKNGVLVCIAAGNSGDNTRFYPAAFDLDSTLVVGAGNSDGFQTYFSTYGAHLDIISPGEDILSLRATGTDMYAPYPTREPFVRIIDEYYYLSDGTSMAAPMVVGAAALIWSFRPDLSLSEMLEVLLHGATDLIDPLNQGDTLPGPDTLCGWGYLNIDASLGLLQNGGMYVASPGQRTRHTGAVTLKGGSIAGYNGSWTLEYALGLSPVPAQWVELASGNGLPADSILAVFNSMTDEGLVSFRLIDANGHSSVITITYSRANHLELTSPVDGQELEYNIPIYGSAYGPDYDSLVIRYRNPQGTVARLHGSTAEYFDSLFFAWSASGSDTGAFRIYLYGYFGGSVAVDSASVLILSSFANGWPRQMPGAGGMTAVCTDLNRDGIKELVTATTSGLMVYRADNGVGLPGFPVLGGRDVRCAPSIYDVDRDGQDEIIITDSSGIHVFNYDGTYAAGWPQYCFTGRIGYEYAYPVPTIARLRVSAQPGAVPDSAIIIVNNLGQILAYRFNGDRYFYSRELFGEFDARIRYSKDNGGSTSPLATSADLDGDGRIEVVATFSSPFPYTGLAMFEGASGEPAFGLEAPTVEIIPNVSGMALADLDRDGRPEVIVAGLDTLDREHIWIWTKGNQPFADWVVPVDESWMGWVPSYPVVADLDLDGIPEILSTYFEFDKSSLFIYRADGTPYKDSPRGRPGEALYINGVTLGTAGVANLVGDEFPEIIIRSGHLLPTWGPELLHILDYTATPVPGWPKATPAAHYAVTSARHAPLVDDIDNDGKVELVLISEDERLLVWDFEANYDDGRNVTRWLYDNHNSGTLPTAEGVQLPVEEILVPESPELRLAQNYPNPFNPTTSIRFSLPSRQHVKLEVFNMLGQLVTTLRDGVMDPGNHAIAFDGSTLANGVYLYRLTAGGAVLSRKMLLIK